VTESPGDPTLRTIAQLELAVHSVRELFETRFAGYEEAIRLLQAQADREPSTGILNERLGALDKIITLRFDEWNIRTNALAVSNQKSIDLALEAAKEAAAKSESAFNKQIDALAAQIGQAVNSLQGSINDVKDRLTRLEAGGQGSKQSWNVVFAVIGAVVPTIAVIVLLLNNVAK
jgi:hypothetical protein